MIRVEIVKRELKKVGNGYSLGDETVIVNGIHDKFSKYDIREGGPESPNDTSVSIQNEEIISTLLNYSFKEVSYHFMVFSFDRDIEGVDEKFTFNIVCETNYNPYNYPLIKVSLKIDLNDWSRPWSISTYKKELESNIKKLNNPKIKYWQDRHAFILNKFGIEYYPDNVNVLIKPEYDIVLSFLPTLIQNTTKDLLASVDKDAILTYFRFPDEIKTACIQYLTYFVQFLADIEILVDSEIKEEKRQTLLKITPKNKNEGLVRIREALDVYLNAPSSKNFQFEISQYSDVAAQQWNANIYHLKSQLILANSIQQTNQATIELLEIANYKYKQLLESKEHIGKIETEEDVVKGIVKLGQFKWNGITIELGEFLRKLKRVFKK